MWIGIVSGGSISCQGLEECDGKKLWIDGTNFDKNSFTSILNITIQAGHRQFIKASSSNRGRPSMKSHNV